MIHALVCPHLPSTLMMPALPDPPSLLFSQSLLLQVAMTTKKNFGVDERQARWATAHRTLHGLQTASVEDERPGVLAALTNAGGADAAEAAKRRAEIARWVMGILQSVQGIVTRTIVCCIAAFHSQNIVACGLILNIQSFKSLIIDGFCIVLSFLCPLHLQSARGHHSEGPCWECGEAEEHRHWHDSAVVHRVEQ